MYVYVLYIYVVPQNPKSLLTLCKNELVMFDISEVGNPQYHVPFALDLHKSLVTSMEYVNECPKKLTGFLLSNQSKQLTKVYVTTAYKFKFVRM